MVKLFEHLWLVGDLAKKFNMQGETLLAMDHDVIHSLVLIQAEEYQCQPKSR